jgi:hypothetical protein
MESAEVAEWFKTAVLKAGMVDAPALSCDPSHGKRD